MLSAPSLVYIVTPGQARAEAQQGSLMLSACLTLAGGIQSSLHRAIQKCFTLERKEVALLLTFEVILFV